MGLPQLQEDEYEDIPLTPQFAMNVFDEPNFQVDRTVSLPSNPDDRPASLSLLYGLAIMTLDQDGTIQKRMLEILRANNDNITQAQACDSIKLLLMEDLNDQVV